MSHILSEQQLKIINKINSEKDEYFQELVNQKVFPKDISSKLDDINETINKSFIEINNDEFIDFWKLRKILNQLILDKTYLSKQISSINYLKWKLDVVKSNTKISTIVWSFNDWEIWLKWNTSDYTVVKMEGISSYVNLINDILNQIKTTKELIDTSIMAIQSQMKNTTFEYLNHTK